MTPRALLSASILGLCMWACIYLAIVMVVRGVGG